MSREEFKKFLNKIIWDRAKYIVWGREKYGSISLEPLKWQIAPDYKLLSLGRYWESLHKASKSLVDKGTSLEEEAKLWKTSSRIANQFWYCEHLNASSLSDAAKIWILNHLLEILKIYRTNILDPKDPTQFDKVSLQIQATGKADKEFNLLCRRFSALHKTYAEFVYGPTSRIYATSYVGPYKEGEYLRIRRKYYDFVPDNNPHLKVSPINYENIEFIETYRDDIEAETGFFERHCVVDDEGYNQLAIVYVLLDGVPATKDVVSQAYDALLAVMGDMNIPETDEFDKFKSYGVHYFSCKDVFIAAGITDWDKSDYYSQMSAKLANKYSSEEKLAIKSKLDKKVKEVNLLDDTSLMKYAYELFHPLEEG